MRQGFVTVGNVGHKRKNHVKGNELGGGSIVLDDDNRAVQNTLIFSYSPSDGDKVDINQSNIIVVDDDGIIKNAGCKQVEDVNRDTVIFDDGYVSLEVTELTVDKLSNDTNNETERCDALMTIDAPELSASSTRTVGSLIYS